ncbi:germ cell-less protein-like 1 [Empidonax traillii]|uniref:germ cell-less protein-like 1 n=1 Tax=Empidonax traillii TaxID=164674 RepID=UPI000FFD9483|nr:germ cell-less protein-like 1 [Empidonax traillii]
MGALGSRVLRRRGPVPRGEAAAAGRAGRNGKRKRGGAAEGPGDSDSDGDTERDERLLHPRGRRKKLKSTSKYIYQTLFLNGENSDVKICALGEEWNLHKIYLCQVSGSFLNPSRNCAFSKITSGN